MATPTVFITAPAVAPVKYSLLDTVVPINSEDHSGFGVEWDPEFCGPANLTVAACLANSIDEDDSIIFSVDDAAEMTADSFEFVCEVDTPYLIDFGDGTIEQFDGSDGPPAHTYAAPGDYDVTVTGPCNYSGTVTVTVTDGVATGPFSITATITTPKDVTDGKDTAGTVPFAAYHLYTCRLVARGDAEERAARALELGRSRAVEKFLYETVLNDKGIDDLSEPAPVEPVIGLAIVEAALREGYGAQGVIITTADVATILAAEGALVQEGDRLVTFLGTPVAVAGGAQGINPVTGATEDSAWIVGSGRILITQSEKIQTNVLPVMSEPTNEFSVLAERPMSVGFECMAVAVEVITVPA